MSESAMPESAMSKQPSSMEQARRGWASGLARLVTTALLIEGATGLWIWLGPFGISGQLQLLLHTLAGLLLLWPVARYLLAHWRSWRGQTLTATQLLGYLLAGLVSISLASGLVLTWQAALGTVRSPAWSLAHLVSGGGALALLIAHVPVALWRRRASLPRSPPLAAAARGFGVRVAIGALAIAAGIGGASLVWPPGPGLRPIPADHHRPEHLDRFEAYRGSPFAPTFARTASGELVDPALLSGSASCGSAGCHAQILAEWAPSAHRFSAMNPPFRAVQRNFAEERGAAETRYCAGCHDPISLFAGADGSGQALSAPGVQEGCSCVVCHSISQADQRGNADYVLTPPTRYLWEGAPAGPRKTISDFLIRAWPRQHLADYDRNLLRTEAFCGACHKQFIPEALNRFGVSPGQNQYDEWRNGHWHTDDPASDLGCRDCHMRLVADSTDPGRGERGDRRRAPDDGAHRHHGTIATNFLMPEVLGLPNWQTHVRLTRAWIRGETVLPEIADIWPTGPVASLELLAPRQVTAGGRLLLRAIVTNQKAGHNLTTGPLDFVRAWIHLVVRDASGRVLGEWGTIDPRTRRIEDSPGVEHQPGNSRREGTMVLEAVPLDAEGEPLLRHELWRKAGGRAQRVIFPGFTDHQAYHLDLPADARGPLTARAELNFRRYRQAFLDAVVPEMERQSGVLQATVLQSSAERQIALAQPQP